MDPETLAFLRKISKTLFIVLFWLALTCIFAIKGDNAFIENGIKTNNILFYVWALLSLAGVLLILKKLWGKNLSVKSRHQ